MTMRTRTQSHDTMLDLVPPFLLEAPRRVEPTPESDEWRRIWFAVQKRPWRALAVVAGDDGVPTFEVATLLMKAGHGMGEPICIADLRGEDHHAGAFLDMVAYHIGRGERVVMPTHSMRHALTVPIARGADCALLCIKLGTTSLRSVENTVAQIGRDRFLGSVVLHAKAGDEARHAPGSRQGLWKAQR
jgi:hypothetical protein